MQAQSSFLPDEIPVIHALQQKQANKFKALVGVAALQAEFDGWLAKGGAVVLLLSQSQTKGRAVDIPVDRTWGAVKRMLTAIQQVFADDPTVPPTAGQLELGRLAAELQLTLIGTDLGFLKLPMVNEWSAIEQRLNRLDEVLASGVTVRTAIKRLGMVEVIERLQALHEAYGVALGLKGDGAEARLGALAEWEAGLQKLEGGISYLVDDLGKRAALLAMLREPFTTTIEDRKARERAERAASKAAKAAQDAKDAKDPKDAA